MSDSPGTWCWPMLDGPRVGGDPTGLAICCGSCGAWLQARSLPEPLPRLRLDHGLWSSMSRDELLRGLDRFCWQCGIAVEWMPFLDRQPEMLHLAKQVEDAPIFTEAARAQAEHQTRLLGRWFFHKREASR